MIKESTDDERIAAIEHWNSGKYPRAMQEPVHSMIDLMLRVIRDQRAELTQLRQAITNVRIAALMCRI